MSPKLAAVTGATGGIGAAIAGRLAAAGLTVVLVGRSRQKLRQTADRIEAEVPGADLRLRRADLSLLTEVRDLAERLGDDGPPQVVVSNAAVITDPATTTTEGRQRMLTVNHLAPYLLLRLLAERLDGHTPARFVIVGASPRGLSRAPVDLDRLDSRDGLGGLPSLRPFVAYARTKNMNVMTGYALARRLAGTAITVNGAHPGVIGRTGLGRDTAGALRLAAGMLNLVTPGPDTGADTPAWLATAPELSGVTGRFYVKRRAVPTAAHTTDEERCDRLWATSARLVGLPT